MKTYFYKKAVSVILTGAVLLSLTGCLDFGGGKKAVLEAAGVFAENVAAADASALIKASSLDKKSKDATALNDILSLDGKSDEEKAFYEAVEKTIEYEIDEESFESKKGQASVDIVFTMADYESVLKEKYTKIEDLTAAVKKADTKEIKFTAEFVKEDKEWVADNVGSKKFLKLYDYRTAKVDLALTAEMVKGFIDRNMSSFWLAEGGKYVDTIFIEYSYYFDSAVVDYKDRGVKLFFKLCIFCHEFCHFYFYAINICSNTINCYLTPHRFFFKPRNIGFFNFAKMKITCPLFTIITREILEFIIMT